MIKLKKITKNFEYCFFLYIFASRSEWAITIRSFEEERTIYNLHLDTLSPKDIVPASIKESLIVTQII